MTKKIKHWAFETKSGETRVLSPVVGKDQNDTDLNRRVSLIEAAGYDCQSIQIVQDNSGKWVVQVKDNLQTKDLTIGYDTMDEATDALMNDGYIFEVDAINGVLAAEE